MGQDISRRKMAAYIAGTAFCAPLALYAQSISLRPKSRPGSAASSEFDRIRARAGITGEVGISAIDLDTGKVIYEKNQSKSFAPASVLKIITALYALEKLGPTFRFSTQVLTDGTIKNGQLLGNLYLVGSGDPMLDTDHLLALANDVKAAGISSVSGDLFYTGKDFPKISQIDSLQPVQAGYNPPVSGLNLNFNRIYFEWTKTASGTELRLDARGSSIFPKTDLIEISASDTQTQVYSYSETTTKEVWTVSKRALNEKGGVWLPVRKPERYCADIFSDLLAGLGIYIGRKSPAPDLPVLQPIASHESAPLNEMLIHMLKYSINLTAEILGVTATRKSGGDASSLTSSARHMQLWAQKKLSVGEAHFVDHSGLGDMSRITPSDLSSALHQIFRERPEFLSLLRKIKPRDNTGKINTSSKLEIRAKTGTLNFVSSLAGYVVDGVGSPFAFTIMSQDLSRRAAAQAENKDTSPEGSKRWNFRSRRLQHQILNRLSETDIE